MPSNQVQDFSFRMDRTGKMVTVQGAEHVRNVLVMLFGMRPGSDEYDAERGLDLVGRKHKQYIEKTRDSEYEAMITTQISKYTDLVPVNCVAIYLNDSLYVNLQVRYMDEVYNTELSTKLGVGLETLAAQIVNINDFNTR